MRQPVKWTFQGWFLSNRSIHRGLCVASGCFFYWLGQPKLDWECLFNRQTCSKLPYEICHFARSYKRISLMKVYLAFSDLCIKKLWFFRNCNGLPLEASLIIGRKVAAKFALTACIQGGHKGGPTGGQALPIFGTMKRSAFLQKTLSSFAPVVFDVVMGHVRLVHPTWLCPCISVTLYVRKVRQ